MECKGCAKPLPPRKRGRRQEYCSDRCRKAAGRAAAQEASEEEKDLIRSLRGSWLVSQLWPVYTCDDSPRIIALIVPKQIALDEFNHAKGGEPFSEAQSPASWIWPRSLTTTLAARFSNRPSRTSTSLARTGGSGNGISIPPPTKPKLPFELLDVLAAFPDRFGEGGTKLPSP